MVEVVLVVFPVADIYDNIKKNLTSHIYIILLEEDIT